MSLLKSSKFAIAALVGAALSAPAMASTVTFFQFLAESGTGHPEFVYNATTGLTTGSGAIGDGLSLPAGAAAPGLTGVITGGLPGVPNSPPGFGVPPYSILFDLTLSLTGFAPVGNATVAVGSITQNLGGGTFQFTHPAFSKPLLAGIASGALVTENGPSGDNASVLSGSVVYTDSVLEDFFAAAGLTNTGTFSFALTGVKGTYGTTLVGQELHLASFNYGDGTGSFDANPVVVPAPAAVWGGASLVGLLGLARAKKRRDMSL